MQAKPTYALGTAVKITVTLSMDNPDSVKILIKDSNVQIKRDYVDCVKDSARVYTYIYQSLETDVAGTYYIVIKAVYGDYTAKSTDTFELEDADDKFEEEIGMGEV